MLKLMWKLSGGSRRHYLKNKLIGIKIKWTKTDRHTHIGNHTVIAKTVKNRPYAVMSIYRLVNFLNFIVHTLLLQNFVINKFKLI